MRDEDTEVIFQEQAQVFADEKRIEREQHDRSLGLPEENISKADEVNEHNCSACQTPFFIHGRDNQWNKLCPICTIAFLKQKGIQKEGTVDKEMVIRDAIVMPAVTPDEAVAKWKEYQALKEKICEPKDVQAIQGKNFLKKSYWRKLATFFNLSVEIVEEKNEKIVLHGKEVLVYHFRARATHNNGRFAEGTGSCDTYDHATIKDENFMVYDRYNKAWKEATPKSIHNARTTAETRAWNRAVSNLVGGGEVSAEEVVDTGNGHNEKKSSDTIEKKFNNKRMISEPQRKRLYAICKAHNVPDEKMKEYLKDVHGLDSSTDISTDIYQDICEFAEQYQV